VSNHVVVAGPAWTRTVAPVPSNTLVDTFAVVGQKRGLVLDTPYVGSDGLTYAVLGTADLIRVDANTEAYTDGQKVYVTSGGVFTGTSTSNTFVGYANRAKGAVSGPLFVQLVAGV
jgi:hypothetical protein